MQEEMQEKYIISEKSAEGDELLLELAENFAEVYAKFKIHFYKEAFSIIQERETSLSTVETFCVELIHALNQPTVNEFATFINVSAPNAAYKINNLIKKGYIEKIQSEADKREYHLVVTEKYFSYYNLSSSYLARVMRRVFARFDRQELAVLNEVMQIMHEELMPEMPRLNTKGMAKVSIEQEK